MKTNELHELYEMEERYRYEEYTNGWRRDSHERMIVELLLDIRDLLVRAELRELAKEERDSSSS